MNLTAIPLGIGILLCVISSFRVDKYRFSITEDKAAKRININVDGQPFTSYCYADSLMKPILYPLRTTKGTLITRGWPIEPRSGERIDHPHHVGLWFNYGNVNGLDFWNNSTAIPSEKKNEYGTIMHASVDQLKATNEYALLAVTKYWEKPDAARLLKEDTRYIFRETTDTRVIELTITLTALHEKVTFTDNKEGLLGIRVARELEHPSDESVKFTDANGNITEVPKQDNTFVTGNYYSSEGLTGDHVWGTRAQWVNLTGTINQEAISLVILDHPYNIGYPAYWHARGYGLFAVNNLGQQAMSNGKESLNFSLLPGKSITFRYEVLIHSGNHLTASAINHAAQLFWKK
ncbi:hypothetical protein GCM10023231_40710 [Olivibacter ginsenosidimutans]|uniref:Methane oxygenase PmoA n=1 Tax=Olivibacter ginsenosidimutans TaxID=1176537 RepID=A0ABP9CD85_9SPHI